MTVFVFLVYRGSELLSEESIHVRTVFLQISETDILILWQIILDKLINVSVSQSVQPLSCVQLFATPWTAAHQASLSITNSWSLFKLMSIGSVMPSNHLISSSVVPSPPALNLSQNQGLFQ